MTEWDSGRSNQPGSPDGLSDEELLADRVVVAWRRRRLRRRARLVGGALVGVIALSLPLSPGRDAGPAAAAGPRAAVPGARTSGLVVAGTTDRAAIYAGALLHCSGPDTPTEVLVHDHVCATVISKPGSRCLDSAIPMSVRREVAQLLPFPVRFVAQRWGARTGRVTSLIVFGTLTITSGTAATLGVEMLCGPMCGQGETVVLARSATGWRVTGTTGRAWIT